MCLYTLSGLFCNVFVHFECDVSWSLCYWICDLQYNPLFQCDCLSFNKVIINILWAFLWENKIIYIYIYELLIKVEKKSRVQQSGHLLSWFQPRAGTKGPLLARPAGTKDFVPGLAKTRDKRLPFCPGLGLALGQKSSPLYTFPFLPPREPELFLLLLLFMAEIWSSPSSSSTSPSNHPLLHPFFSWKG